MKTILNATIERETEKAVLAKVMIQINNYVTIWLPKSQIETIEEKRITVADWLINKLVEEVSAQKRTSKLNALSIISKIII